MHKRINMCTYILYFKYIGQMNDKKKKHPQELQLQGNRICNGDFSVECGDNGDV